MVGSVVNSTSYRYRDDTLFNEIEIKITKALYYAGYKGNLSDYPHLKKIKENSSAIDEILINLNDHLRENNNKNNYKKLIELINGGQDLGINNNYKLDVCKDCFYLNSSGVSTCSGNPFGEQDEVLKLIGLYYTITSKEYKGTKDIKLKDGLSTMADFCCEINRIYHSISSPSRSNLKKALDKFTEHNDVAIFIGSRKHCDKFYKFVKSETDLVNSKDNNTTQDNIRYISSEVKSATLEQIAVPLQGPSVVSVNLHQVNEKKAIVAVSKNPFSTQNSDVYTLVNLYKENIKDKYNGQKIINLSENIGSLDDFCREINQIKSDTSETYSSSRYKLLADFIKNEEVATLIGKMEGVPGDFYTKQTESICNHGMLLQRALNEYVNGVGGIDASQAEHRKKIERDLKNKTLRDNISIELEANGNVIIRSFPNDNEKIASVLTALLGEHQSNGTLSHKIAEFLKISRLGAYMQLQPLPGKLKIQVSVNQDTVESVNDKTSHLNELMDFISKHLKHINTELDNFPKRPEADASLAQLQKYHYKQMLAFDIHSSNYTEPRGNIISAKRWIQAKWGNVIGSVTKETYFGGKNDKPIDTIKKLRELLSRNVNNQNYEKSVLNGFKYPIINEGLDRIEKQAQRLDHLVTHHFVSEDMAKNLTFALCYSIASECVDLKQQSKSINFNKFRSKAKFVVPMVAALSVGVLIAGSLSTVLAPLAPILAIGICCFGLYYLITKCKPKLEKSEMSEQLTLAMNNLVYQKDFHLDSHDVGWMEAWKYRKEAIKRAAQAWWSRPVVPADNLSEA
ncbi:TPA: MFS transporter permease [Yersinia enterocolitica]